MPHTHKPVVFRQTNNLSDTHLALIEERIPNRRGRFELSFEIPEGIECAPSALRGPSVGDEPVTGELVRVKKRTQRVARLPMRTSRQITVFGTAGQKERVIFAAFGGHTCPKGPCDPTRTRYERAESDRFWEAHALSIDNFPWLARC